MGQIAGFTGLFGDFEAEALRVELRARALKPLRLFSRGFGLGAAIAAYT